jgi:hypothetical protein
LKKADWEAEFFFMGWEFGGVLIFAEALSGASTPVLFSAGFK